MADYDEFQEVEEEEEDEDDKKEVVLKDSLIMLVDFNPSMLEPTDDFPEGAISAFLSSCAATMKEKVIANSTDQVALVLYSTRTLQNQNSFEHVYVLQDLDEPSAERIRQTQALAEALRYSVRSGQDSEAARLVSQSTKKLIQDIGHSTEVSLYEALWSTSSVFSAPKQSANCTKRVFIFTNVSDPCQAPGSRARAEQKLRDLAENDIVVELFAVNPPAPIAKFDMHTFWTRAIMIDDEDSEFRPLNANSLKALTDDLRRRAFKRRSQLAGHIIIGRQQQNCSRIGFRMYSCIRSAETGKAVFLDAATNAPLTCETKWLCKDTAALLEDFQMRTYYSYGGERVYITKAEMQLLKQIGESGLELMGFKPMATLQPYHNVKNPAFIYPDEQLVKGSTVAFKALLHEMHLQQKYAVARLVFRKTGVPRFVALLPQMEQVDEGGFQITPPGMNLIYLPFADEIRQIKTGTAQPHADTELVKAATQVVRALRLPSFEPDNFVNPALQRHYRVLEALALHEQLSVDASADDRLQPDVDGFARAAPVIEQFEQCWEKAAAALPPPSVAAPKAAAKRAAPAKRAKVEADDDDDEAAPRAKKSKKAAAPASDAAGGADVWRAKCADGSVAKATVAELKEVLKGFGLKVSGAKGELVDRLTDYFISN